MTATFLALDQPGLLTAVPPPFAWPSPAGFTFVGPPLEIRSTALAPAAVIAGMRPAAGEFPERLFLLENGQVDRSDAHEQSRRPARSADTPAQSARLRSRGPTCRRSR